MYRSHYIKAGLVGLLIMGMIGSCRREDGGKESNVDNVGNEKKEVRQKEAVIAVVLGREIGVDEAEQLNSIIVKALFEQFAVDHKIEPTEEEMECLTRRTEAIQQQRMDEMAVECESLRESIKNEDLIEEERAKQEEKLENLEKALASMQETRNEIGALDDAHQRKIKMGVAHHLVKSWKINAALYARYGGRAIFQQFGPEPLDAYRDYLKEQEKAGAFEIIDKQYEPAFWKYYTDESMHVFYPGEDADQVINTPWWMMEESQ